MFALIDLFKQLFVYKSEPPVKLVQSIISVRYFREKPRFIVKPKTGCGKSYRRIVHYPEEYTVQPLNVTNLGGRDPVTGRKVCQRIGGGIKHKYHWVKWLREGPLEDPPQEEKVIQIIKCGCRTANVALVGFKDQMKYILATENMKAGDIIRTSLNIPQNPVRPNEGDAYPLGALPLGTLVHNIQIHPGVSYTLVHSAGCCATIKRYLGSHVIVQLPSKQEMAMDKRCMATVGILSNIQHSSTPIGSASKARELGIRPKSGLWHRKKGVHGRKIKPLPPVKYFEEPKPQVEFIQCTHPLFD